MAAFLLANGIQASLVHVDTDTGIVTLLKHWVVEDCGRVINPMLADEQLRGGVVQGLGAALYEEFRYDDDGDCFCEGVVGCTGSVEPSCAVLGTARDEGGSGLDRVDLILSRRTATTTQFLRWSDRTWVAVRPLATIVSAADGSEPMVSHAPLVADADIVMLNVLQFVRDPRTIWMFALAFAIGAAVARLMRPRVRW